MNPSNANSQFRSLIWGLISYGILLLAYGAFLLAHPSPLLTIPFGFTFLLLPLWVFALMEIVLFERQEILDFAKKRDDHIFEDSYEQVILRRQKQLHQKVILPLCLVLGMVGPLMIAVVQSVNPWNWPNLPQDQLRANLGFLFFLAAFQFVLGRYYIGIGSTERKWSGVSTIGGVLIYSTLVTVTLAVESLLSSESLSFTLPWIKVVCVFFALVYPVELLFHLLTYSYSHQSKEFPFYCPIWPRGRLSQKWKNQAQASLQYQFGYDLGSNLRQLGLRHGGPALILFILCWLGASAILIVPQGSEAFVTRLGVLQHRVYPAGFHTTLPWPIERSYIVNTRESQRLFLGGSEKTLSLLWDSPEHSKDLHLMVRSPKNLSDQWPIEIWSVNASIDYCVKNPILWILHQLQPEQIIKELALRRLTLNHLNIERDRLFDTSRDRIENELRNELQAECDRLEMGIEIIKFSIPQIHPPQECIESFNNVIKARFEKESRLSKAHGFVEQLEARVKNEEITKLAQAQASAEQKKAQAMALLKVVQLISPVVNLNPSLYWQRQNLATLPKISKDMQKILILRDGGTQVQTLNLEPSLNPELLDLNLETRFNK